MDEAEWFMLLIVTIVVFMPVNSEGRSDDMPSQMFRAWSDLTQARQDEQTLFCLVQGCQVVIDHGHFLCERHFEALTWGIKKRLVKHQDGCCWRGKAWKDSEMSRDVNESLHLIGKGA
jgi:hypothetical protein